METEALQAPRAAEVVCRRDDLDRIGQGYNSYTPLQLAQAMATLVNGGTM